MASTFLKDDYLISCGVCTKPFNSTERVPKILQCLHVVCLSCAERISTGGNISCSICKEKTRIGPNGGQELLTDPTRLRLRQLAEISKQTGSIPCNDCPDYANARYYCQNCNDFYCKECHDLHLSKRNRFSRDHTIIALSAVTPEILHSSQKLQNCPDHDKPLILFCNKAECNVAICVSCTVSKHRDTTGHDICNVSDAYRRKKEDIEQIEIETKQELKRVEATKEQDEANLKHIEKLKTGVIKEIDEEFQYLFRLIKRRRDALVNRSMIMKEDSSKRVQEMVLSQERIKAALTFEDNARVFCTATEFIKLEGTIRKRFEVLNEKKTGQRPVYGYDLQYKQKMSKELFKTLSIDNECMGSQTLRLDSSEVKTSGAIQNMRSEIAKIILKNQHGVTQLVNTESVEAIVTDSNGKRTKSEVEQNVTDMSMDVYLRATTSGDYGLHINVLGQPLNGCVDFQITLEFYGYIFDIGAKLENHILETMPYNACGHGNIVRAEALREPITVGTACAASPITCPQFTIDKKTVHGLLKVSDDGKNLSYGGFPRLGRGTGHRGGRGTMIETQLVKCTTRSVSMIPFVR